MREFTVPLRLELGPEENLTTPVYRREAEEPHTVALARKVRGTWTDVSAGEFAAEVTRVAKGLLAAGIQPGDRVGLMCRTRYEWTLADCAILAAGAVSVPIYETSAAEQVAWNLGDSGAVGVVVEQERHQRLVDAVAGRLPELRHVWQVDSGGLDGLAEAASSVADADFQARRTAIRGADLATLIYTSGTTGAPKGCELSHRNLLFDAATTVSDMREVFARGSSTLLFLPLAHVFARVIQIGCLVAGVRLGHTADVKNLLPDLAEFRPTFVLSVPRVFEKIHNGARTRARAAGSGSGKVFDLADSVAVRYSQALASGRPNPVLTAQHLLFDKLVYTKIRAQLGGEVRHVISGGAPLGVRLGHFFRGIGLPVLEGYGLTESAAAVAVNRPGQLRVGTVGQPIPGVTVRIADDAEILVHGDNVFRGYWHNPSATAEVLDGDGWLHTGDLGELDEAGFLRITGRKKEIIVTAGGKNVSPAALEDAVRAHPLVSQCLVVGDQRPYVAALVTLDADHLATWRAERARPAGAGAAKLDRDPDLRAELDAAIAHANESVSRAEAIRRYRVLERDFTEEGGQLTPTLKVKRAVVAREFAAEIEQLYRD